MMTFPIDADAFGDRVQVWRTARHAGREGASGRAETPDGPTLPCSVQPVVGQVATFAGLGQAAAQSEYRVVFPADPGASGVGTDTKLTHTVRRGVTLASPRSYRVTAVEPDGGPDLTWTAYIKSGGD